jgi:uncharacterized membrane protein AbrB (regulator of aidB expression)
VRPSPETRNLVETLATAGLGGLVFDHVGFPAGWLAGAMTFAAAAALARSEI